MKISKMVISRRTTIKGIKKESHPLVKISKKKKQVNPEKSFFILTAGGTAGAEEACVLVVEGEKRSNATCVKN